MWGAVRVGVKGAQVEAQEVCFNEAGRLGIESKVVEDQTISASKTLRKISPTAVNLL